MSTSLNPWGRRTLLVMLVLGTVLAGCTTPEGSTGPDNPANNTTNMGTAAVLDTVSVADTQMYEGTTTELLVSVVNPRSTPIDSVRVEIGNTGALQLVRQQPQQDESQYECRYAQIPPEDGDFTPERRCIWSVHAPTGIVGSLRDRATFPITAFAAYSSILDTRGESLDVTFEPANTVTPSSQQQQVVQAQNQDVGFRVEHRSPVAAEEQAIPLTITVTNRGDGDIVAPDQDKKRVRVVYTGMLADEIWDPGASTCFDGTGGLKTKTIQFPENRQQITIDCEIVLQSGNLQGRTFFLRPELHYRYRTSQETQLTVEK